MSLLEAIVLGIVQGLTEFLPISSTAHLRIVPAALGWDDPGAPFTAVIQLGTLAAVLAYFGSDLRKALAGWMRSFRGGDAARTPEARLGWATAIGTIPIVAAGLAFSDQIEHGLRSLTVIAWTLIGLGVLLGIAEVAARHTRKISDARPLDGLVVGVFQAASLIPGVSRSGSTITGALFLGFEREAAARFSFVLSTPAIFLAGAYQLVANRERLLEQGIAPVAAATAVSFAVGYASIAFLMSFLKTKSTFVFVAYRIALGVLLLIAVLRGNLSP
jgi:undecaprenyl-diphosphatase